eukprot:TRINITY_DN3647_c0_g1_i1.p1 TRINITY_DN3647_c0_g1~~TRINITY_DN3647_c0_g1_i1.p1  ORF type:complete len:256 (-),score=111.88 TRINITY_DN3647_c0_g1_i1:140-907(-)
MSETDFNNMKIADLKKELKAKGLPVSGNKQDLVERLQTSGDLLDDNDDLLDQDDSMTDEAIKKAEEELKVPSKPPKINRDVPITPSKTEAVENGASKVSVTDPSPKGKENAPVAVNTTEEAVSPEKEKLTEEEMEAKIKARADRFGGFQSEDAKKVARAARFGDMVPKVEGKTKIGGAPPADLDLLKKRAERFGTATSTVVKTAELSDAIKRRQERFGVIAKDEPKPKKIALNGGVNSVVLDEKMKARQERFKIQ